MTCHQPCRDRHLSHFTIIHSQTFGRLSTFCRRRGVCGRGHGSTSATWSWTTWSRSCEGRTSTRTSPPSTVFSPTTAPCSPRYVLLSEWLCRCLETGLLVDRLKRGGIGALLPFWVRPTLEGARPRHVCNHIVDNHNHQPTNLLPTIVHRVCQNLIYRAPTSSYVGHHLDTSQVVALIDAIPPNLAGIAFHDTSFRYAHGWRYVGGWMGRGR